MVILRTSDYVRIITKYPVCKRNKTCLLHTLRKNRINDSVELHKNIKRKIIFLKLTCFHTFSYYGKGVQEAQGENGKQE
jgi:hypothetical protein